MKRGKSFRGDCQAHGLHPQKKKTSFQEFHFPHAPTNSHKNTPSICLCHQAGTFLEVINASGELSNIVNYEANRRCMHSYKHELLLALKNLYKTGLFEELDTFWLKESQEPFRVPFPRNTGFRGRDAILRQVAVMLHESKQVAGKVGEYKLRATTFAFPHPTKPLFYTHTHPLSHLFSYLVSYPLLTPLLTLAAKRCLHRRFGRSGEDFIGSRVLVP